MSTISLYENTSLVFFKTFPFGTNSIFEDINQLCSITKDEIELIVENLYESKSNYIEQKFFINSDYKKLSTNHIKEIISARVKEIIDYTFNNNKNLIYYENKISKINLLFEDRVIFKSLNTLFKDYLQFNQNKIEIVASLNDDFASLFGAAELIFKGWHNEALPYSNKKKSMISSWSTTMQINLIWAFVNIRATYRKGNATNMIYDDLLRTYLCLHNIIQPSIRHRACAFGVY